MLKNLGKMGLGKLETVEKRIIVYQSECPDDAWQQSPIYQSGFLLIITSACVVLMLTLQSLWDQSSSKCCKYIHMSQIWWWYYETVGWNTLCIIYKSWKDCLCGFRDSTSLLYWPNCFGLIWTFFRHTITWTLVTNGKNSHKSRSFILSS